MAVSSVVSWLPDRGVQPHPAGRRGPRLLGQPHPFDLAAAAKPVHLFVARRVRNPDDAADIAQQALLVACAKRDTCQNQNASGWLFAIARNLIVDYYRARGRSRFVEASSLADTEPALQTAPDAVHVTCQQRERLSRWVDCMNRNLPLEEQVAVLLADVYGHWDRDSAAELGLSLPSFKLLLHRARTRLNSIAGGRCGLVCNATAAECARCSGGESVPDGLTRRSRLPEVLALRDRLLRDLDP
jgi:RNA polymerase sigma-70 factor, ECF subfamily